MIGYVEYKKDMNMITLLRQQHKTGGEPHLFYAAVCCTHDPHLYNK